MELYKWPKDILVKLILLLKNNYEERIEELEMRIQLCRDIGIKFHYCNDKNCEGIEVTKDDETSLFYKCYSCKNNFCDSHITYCQTCEDFMCLDDISICEEYHRDFSNFKND